jgi:hypothetical protein
VRARGGGMGRGKPQPTPVCAVPAAGRRDGRAPLPRPPVPAPPARAAAAVGVSRPHRTPGIRVGPAPRRRARARARLSPRGPPFPATMKYVLVTGGVVSGLGEWWAGAGGEGGGGAGARRRIRPPLPSPGKGVCASSLGVILKNCGHRVTSIKIGGRRQGEGGGVARARGGRDSTPLSSQTPTSTPTPAPCPLLSTARCSSWTTAARWEEQWEQEGGTGDRRRARGRRPSPPFSAGRPRPGQL